MNLNSPLLTFPLTKNTLRRNNISPDFPYSQMQNARFLLHQERLSGTIDSSIPVYASDLAGIGLMGKIYAWVILRYLSHDTPTLLQDLDTKINGEIPKDRLQHFLQLFIDSYPIPDSIQLSYRSLSSHAPGESEQQLACLTVILIHLLRENSAAAPYHPIFLSSGIINHPTFNSLVSLVESALANTTVSSISSESMLSFLKKPSRLHPASIVDQLSYIHTHWKTLLPKDLYRDLSRRIDFIKEEKKDRGRPPGGSPVVLPPFPDHAEGIPDERHFSQDEDWMSNAVLIAKNVYVWLDQLSKKHQRQIITLDAIPESELEDLSRRGINCLWLIGIWERSPASREIKRRCGNPEAIPSAYSIYDYVIADNLGGENALHDLKIRAAHAGIRLAADMVPNHMGIFSRWILEHPERFLSLNHKPFPSYSYTGPDLSPSDKISIYLEDHYYQQTDAAVVFKRVDNTSGETSFIYHGNDGTAMPWNDTAQLNFLKSAVREAVLDTILDVADHFSIIRFDAAMTLAKKHYQRLWFPPPGEGGAIPTRSEHGLTREKFEDAFPVEFWRQVVDRISAERPDTLLVAEAFWMMEGYFVRTLGMHRVYNSAFMHMLRDENNSKYRDLIIKTLNFDPGILKRYVNFMNNPDEETAVAQFGKGGKYFGVCTMMCTLPGTPMFGHGQIEGYHEKYGMEYHRAYYEETPDLYLLEEHRQKIFPLLKKRHIFSHAEHFVLYDFITEQETVDENVFAYSNRHGDQSALVVYHNKWGNTTGTILNSSIDSNRKLGSALNLNDSDQFQDMFITYKDLVSGDEYLLPSRRFFNEGIQLALAAYECHVFYQFQQVKDNDHKDYQNLYSEIGTSGVSNLKTRLSEIRYLKATSIWFDLIHVLKNTGDERKGPGRNSPLPDISTDISQDPILRSKLETLYTEVLLRNRSEPDLPDDIPQNLSQQCLSYLISLARQELGSIPHLASSVSIDVQYALLIWATLSPLFLKVSRAELNSIKQNFADKIQQELDFSNSEAHKLYLALDILFDKQPAEQIIGTSSAFQIVRDLIKSAAVRNFIGVHTYQDTRYFHKESWEDFIKLYFSAGIAQRSVDKNQDFPESITGLKGIIKDILSAADQSSYRLDVFIECLRQLTH